MRRVYLLLGLAGVAVVAGLFGRGGSASLARQEEAPPPARLADAPPANVYQGVASCTSVACHHGNGPRGSKGSEYTTWIAQGDPHSRAYAVLFDARSLLIEKNYRQLANLKEARPHQDKLCLDCHVHPDAETARHGERFTYADGVGCESCHGPAEKWLSVHYNQPKDRDALRRLGMWDTKDVRRRAEICVRCHVGAGEADVNHDLIAAGHPRLRFEYGAYLANYPARHWRVADDHARYADFEARAWLLGQAVSAKAAVELLQYRADPKHDKPWPEFAEYGCFACHHDLRDQAWRRRPGAGALPWGTWYSAHLPLPAAGREPIAPLSRMMAHTYPDRKRVVEQSAAAAAALDRLADRLQQSKCRDEAMLRELLADLVRGDEAPDWDGAAQRYLGIAAIYNALGDADARYREDNDLKAAVRRLAETLSRAFQSDGAKYDSPRDYRPELLQMSLQQLREDLQRRGVR